MSEAEWVGGTYLNGRGERSRGETLQLIYSIETGASAELREVGSAIVQRGRGYAFDLTFRINGVPAEGWARGLPNESQHSPLMDSGCLTPTRLVQNLRYSVPSDKYASNVLCDSLGSDCIDPVWHPAREPQR